MSAPRYRIRYASVERGNSWAGIIERSWPQTLVAVRVALRNSSRSPIYSRPVSVERVP